MIRFIRRLFQRRKRLSNKELNFLMELIDFDLTARGIEHDEPPYFDD